MSETLIRILSGIVYMALLLVAILISEYTLAGIVFIFGCFTLFELQHLLKIKSYLAYVILIAGMAFFTFFHYFHLQWAIDTLMIITLIVDLLLVRDLLVIRKIPIFEGRKYLMMFFYMIASLVFLTLIPYQNAEQQYNPMILVGVFLLIWSNDSFAYLIGKTFGKRKLIERISPNKTIAGFLGGLLLSLGVAFGIYKIIRVFPLEIWLGISLIASIFGTFGDLIQSKLKRQAGVKDSGHLMPGHGGLFDRLDSTLFAATFIYSFLAIVGHVS